MKEEGFSIINVRTQKAYTVVDATGVAQLIGKDRRTIQNWFAHGEKMAFRKDWMIVKGYEVIRSRRGRKKGSKAPRIESHPLTPVQDLGDY